MRHTSDSERGAQPHISPTPRLPLCRYAAIPGALGYGVGAAVQLLLLLALPLAFQLSLGAAFHRLLMIELKLLFAALARLGRALAAAAAALRARRKHGGRRAPAAPPRAGIETSSV